MQRKERRRQHTRNRKTKTKTKAEVSRMEKISSCSLLRGFRFFGGPVLSNQFRQTKQDENKHDSMMRSRSRTRSQKGKNKRWSQRWTGKSRAQTPSRKHAVSLALHFLVLQLSSIPRSLWFSRISATAEIREK